MTTHSIISVIIGAIFCLGAAVGFRDVGLSLRTGVFRQPYSFVRAADIAFARRDRPNSFWGGVVVLAVLSLIFATVGSTLVVVFFAR